MKISRLGPSVCGLIMALSIPSVCADLTLAQAVQDALNYSANIRAQQDRYTAAQQQLPAVDALPDPQLYSGVANVPVASMGGVQAWSTAQNAMSARVIGINQEFPNSGKRQAARASALAGVQIAVQEIAKLQSELAISTAEAWIDLRAVEYKQTILKEQIKDSQLLTNLIKQQLAAGQGSAVDVLQSQLELLELENALNQNQGQMASAVAQLRRFVGDDATMHISGDVPAWPLSYQEVQQHLKHHPDLLLAHANVVEEEAKVAAAVAEQHPDWGLGLSYQHRGPSFADMVSLTVSMSLPIFPSHRQGPKLSAERSRLRAAQDELIDIQRQHAAQLQSDWTRLQALTAQIDRLHDQELPLAQQKIDLLVGNYRAGKSEINTLLVARSERRQLLLRLIDQQAQRDRLAARLHYQYQYSVREMTP